MSSQHIIDQLQPYDFDRLAHKEKDGRRRLRLIALAGRSYTDVAAALRVTRHAVMRWVQRFSAGGVARLAGMLHDWSTQRLAKAQEEAFRLAVEQLQRERGGGRLRGEDIRQLLAGQFGVAYSLNGVYDLIKRLGMVWISARAVSPYADPVAQAEMKNPAPRDGVSHTKTIRLTYVRLAVERRKRRGISRTDSKKTSSRKSRQRCRQALRLSKWMCGFKMKCALASAARKHACGRARERAPGWCVSSSPNRRTSLAPSVHSTVARSV